MEELVLRRAVPADAALIAAIDAATGAPASPAHDVRRAALLADGHSWVAGVGGAGAGYALASRGFFARPFVDLLVVAPAFRRQGVGLALMAACQHDHDEDRLFTSTNRSNSAMRALLAKAGFQPSGRIDNLDPGDPELVFVSFTPPT
jgi:GNAT superfamily N-acetyltransferase